jgi:PAS domain S-box-containing protein
MKGFTMYDRPLRVLIVEDDEDDYIILREMLTEQARSAYDIAWTSSGGAALHGLERTSYDVCILDYQLGDWNGLDLLNALNSRGLGTPVIFLTGHADHRIDTEAMEAGATDYLVKGRFSTDMLERSIRYAIKQKSIEGQLRQKNQELSSLLDELEDRIEQRTVELRKACDSLLNLSKAIEQAAEAVVLLDTGGFIQYMNPAFERITGYGRADVTGEHIKLLRSEDHDERFYSRICEELKRGRIWEGRINERKKDGSIYCADTTVSTVLDSSGTILGYVAIKRDVTRETAIETRLRQAQKLEAIGVLSGGIAHDFNNILGAAVLFTELAMDEVLVESKAREDLQEVLDACNRGKKLIEQMLTFSRTRGEKYEPVELSPIVKETVRFLRASLPASIKILSHFETTPPDADTVLADPTQIHQLLVNLCVNASHAMREKGGAMSVSLTSVTMDGNDLEQLNQDLQPGRHLILEVTDTGYGIAPEMIDKIFTPYFTTKETGEGSGMGLAVVYGIVRNHHGSIKVKSRPGETSFQVYLPVLTPGTSEKQTGRLQPSGGSEEILLVDDEQVILKAGLRTLKSLGYRVTVCASPAEALDLFTDGSERFDLVITDLTMSHMSGIELAKELTRIRPGIPIILCTGYGHKVDEAEAQSVGIKKMLQKPVARKDLAKAIRDVMKRQ